jgi:hypothetical protein
MSLTPTFVDGLTAAMRGPSYSAVVDGQVRDMPIAVAPTGEQDRIVAAFAAGVAVMLSLETRARAAVGVAISVTTIPAAAYLGVALGTGNAG